MNFDKLRNQYWLIKHIVEANRDRKISKIPAYSQEASELLDALRKNGAFKGVESYGITVEVNKVTYYVDTKNFPVEDLAYILVRTEDGKEIHLFDNIRPSMLSRVRFWLWINDNLNGNAKGFIKLVNAGCANRIQKQELISNAVYPSSSLIAEMKK